MLNASLLRRGKAQKSAGSLVRLAGEIAYVKRELCKKSVERLA